MTTMSARDRERKHELYYMAIALLSERRSRDPVRKVGACIVDEREGGSRKENEGRVIGIGYNGMPINCRDELTPWTEESPEKEKLKNLFVVHAEANAIVNMNPQSVADCAIYVTLHPCCECAIKLIQGGISKVVYLSFDKCYKRKNPFKDSTTFLQTLKDDKEIKYIEFADQQKDEMILEIQFKSPEKKTLEKEPPRKVGSHCVWRRNKELDSENGPDSKKPRLDLGVIEYKPGYKYIAKKIELLEKGEIPDSVDSKTLKKCEQIWSNKSIAKLLKRITWEQYFMGMAILVGDLRGSEPHEGACVVNEDRRIIKLGYFRIIGQIKGSKKEKKLGVHAPVTAIVNRGPVSLRDCTLYVTRFPCNECAKAIVQAGIKTVVYLDGGDGDNYSERDNTEAKKKSCKDAEDRNPAAQIAEGNIPEEVNDGDKNLEGDDAGYMNPKGDNAGDNNRQGDDAGDLNPERENTEEKNPEGNDAGGMIPDGENAGEENPVGEKTEEENPKGENTEDMNLEEQNAGAENPEDCAEQQVEMNAKKVSPERCAKQQVKVKAQIVSLEGCAKQQAKVKDKKITPDPAKKMFDLAKVKVIWYKTCYKTDPVILDFSKSKL